MEDHDQEHLPTLSVRFAPTDLPPGAVDMEDFSQFLDGVNLALDGLVQYEMSTGLLVEPNLRPRLTIAAIRSGSVECDIIVNFYISGTATAILGVAGVSLVGAAAFVAKEVASALIKDGLDGVGKGARRKITDVVGHFMHSLKDHTTPVQRGETPSSSPPPELTLNMLAGLRKMAKIGAKQPYGPDGIAVRSDVEPGQEVAFNADALRNVERHASEALATQELVKLEGTIEDPSTRRHKFRLERPGQPKSNSSITCFYDKRLEDKVRDLYARRAFIQIEGIKMHRFHANSAKPRIIVQVNTIVEKEVGLWASGDHLGERL